MCHDYRSIIKTENRTKCTWDYLFNSGQFDGGVEVRLLTSYFGLNSTEVYSFFLQTIFH